MVGDGHECIILSAQMLDRTDRKCGVRSEEGNLHPKKNLGTPEGVQIFAEWAPSTRLLNLPGVMEYKRMNSVVGEPLYKSRRSWADYCNACNFFFVLQIECPPPACIDRPAL